MDWRQGAKDRGGGDVQFRLLSLSTWQSAPSSLVLPVDSFPVSQGRTVVALSPLNHYGEPRGRTLFSQMTSKVVSFLFSKKQKCSFSSLLRSASSQTGERTHNSRCFSPGREFSDLSFLSSRECEEEKD